MTTLGNLKYSLRWLFRSAPPTAAQEKPDLERIFNSAASIAKLAAGLGYSPARDEILAQANSILQRLKALP